MIRATAADPQVEHLYVIVNASGTKNFNTSSYERVQLIQAALLKPEAPTQYSLKKILNPAKQARPLLSVIRTPSAATKLT
jgi:phosphopantetheine adenylyltransferase